MDQRILLNDLMQCRTIILQISIELIYFLICIGSSPELLPHIGQQSQYTEGSWRRGILFLPYIPGSRKVNNANHKQFAMIYIYM